MCGESLWLFLAAWATLGCFVHTRNQVTWNLQHAWVESLAERGAMHVEGSPTPQLALDRLGDYWTAPDGHAYARSAPGTYLTAAAVYGVLARLFGVSYRGDFDLASTLVTFLTTGLASALVFLLLYRTARQATGSRPGAVLVAFAYAFGTHAFPYSGVLYQHLTAAAFFVAAFALAFRRRRGRERPLQPALEGALLGLGAGYSFAFLPMGLCLAGYCLTPLGRRRTAFFLAGAAAGITPLLVLNALYYGGPLTTIYQASQDPNLTTFRLSWDAIAWRLRFYFADPTTGLFYYSPVLLLALPGLLLLPRELRCERTTVAAGALLTLGHLFVVGGTGDAQFPPRLVIPMLPFLALGFVPFWSRGWSTPRARRLARAAFVLLLAPSVAFCTLGALGRVAFRDVARWNAWYVYLHSLWPPLPEGMPAYNLTSYAFPLRPVLLWVALAAAAVAAWRLLALGRESCAPAAAPAAPTGG